jgi:hypothetical protein
MEDRGGACAERDGEKWLEMMLGCEPMKEEGMGG